MPTKGPPSPVSTPTPPSKTLMLTSLVREHLFVDRYEELIKRRIDQKLPWVSEPIEHFADLVIAIARRRFEEESTFAPAQFDEESTCWRHIREHLWKTLRVLEALPIIATKELKQNKDFAIPGIVQLKVSSKRLEKAKKPKSKATTVKAFPSKALKAAALHRGSSSSSSSSRGQF